MSRFSDKLREAISASGISQTAVARQTQISRQIINYTLQRGCRLRSVVAEMIVITIGRALDKKIEEQRRSIENLMRIKHELREAMEEEYSEAKEVRA